MRRILILSLLLGSVLLPSTAMGQTYEQKIEALTPEEIQKTLDWWLQQNKTEMQKQHLEQQMRRVLSVCEDAYCEWA